MVNQPTLLSSQLFYKNRVVEVTLTRVILGFCNKIGTRRKRSANFSCISKDADHHFLLVSEIVGALETEEEDQTNKDGGRKREVLLYPYAFTVSYTERTKHHCWRCKDIIFHCLDEAQRQQWVQTINNQLSLLSSRPKRLLVYVNPYSGKQRGKRIYEQRVAPLFSRASISTDVIVTESANHARDHLKEVDLKQCDGVVCVGGDGMFSEVVHGLVSSTQSDSRVDQNQPNQDLVPCALRIGIIPAGSTDCICYATTGTNDPVTSALHIIMADHHFLLVSEIVGALETEEEDQTNKDGGRKREVLLYPYAFTVSYTERTKHHCWRCKDIIFHCLDEAQRQQWVQTINNQLSLLSSRPKRLLVYVNPYSGKQRGKRIYEQRVAPLFSRASISTDVIVTESANHARDHLKEVDLKQCDGVVCVGGDGMFSEVVHGLVSSTQSDSRVDQNQPNQDLVPCALRIGIIPAGSTDCICYATTGTNDPVTSALHIIMGDSQPMDVCSVHHNNTFLRYSVSLLGYGFYGDVLMDSEKKRWMGPSRYDLSGLKTFLTHQYYEGTVTFLPAEDSLGNPRDKIKCRTGCHICEQGTNNRQPLSGDHDYKMAEENSDKETSGDGVWRVIRGKFLAINAASMSCACPRSPRGLSPSAHLADGTTDLILVRKASRLDFLRHLIRHTNKEDQFDMSFVEVHRVRRFRFIPKHSNVTSEVDLSEVCTAQSSYDTGHSNWSCDGEILPHAAIQVSVHCQLIRLFARGVESGATLDTYRRV